ncbi:MAG TPA: hypothetical protein VKW04_13515 [Planctomycetota bacterium]|nr:hypothetical protein [Planctomycetota bacterium]
MKAAAWALIPFGALIVLLVLNLNEIDHYEFGTETPPAPGNNVDADDPGFSRIFPERSFVHACPGCGECVHRYEILENRRVLQMVDHDGWYKLFWAGDDLYYYSDPVHLIADWGQNRTAESPTGTWTIRVRTAAATHAPGAPHECGRLPREISLTYALTFSDAPLDDTPYSGDGPMKILQAFSWLTSNSGRPVSLGWRLQGAPAVEVAPCDCSHP